MTVCLVCLLGFYEPCRFSYIYCTFKNEKEKPPHPAKGCSDEFWEVSGDPLAVPDRLVGEPDPSPPNHHRPVVRVDIDRRSLVEAPAFRLRELALTEELTALSRTQLPSEKPGMFVLGEGFPRVTHEGGAGRQEKAARCRRKKDQDGFHGM